MANPHRGELTITVGQRSYTLRLTTNACAEMEDLAKGRTFRQVALGVQLGSARDLRLLLWAALRGQHPDIARDGDGALKRIGDLLDEWQNDEEAVRQLQALLGLNADPNEAPVAKGKKGKANPPQAPTGTGTDSPTSASLPA